MKPRSILRKSWTQPVIDFAVGGSTALLGCALLAAAALHLIASVDLGPDVEIPVAMGSPAHPSSFRPYRIAPPRRVAPRPKAVGRPVKFVVALRARVSSGVRSQSPEPHAAIGRVRPVGATLAVVRPRALPTARPTRPAPLARPARHGKMKHAPERRPGHGRARAGRPSALPVRFRFEPSLVGVSGGAVAIAPRLEGLRMRGKILVPTPAPVVPFSRSGLSPGP